MVGQAGASEGCLVLLSLNTVPVDGRPGLLFGGWVLVGAAGWNIQTSSNDVEGSAHCWVLRGYTFACVVLWLLLAWIV